jgi:hypothetical protein
LPSTKTENKKPKVTLETKNKEEAGMLSYFYC